MSFIRSFSINTNKLQPFPFNIPAVRFAKNIALDKINIFVGDNGSGKSTLLETIAYSVNLPLISGFIGDVADFEAARKLKPYAELDWMHNTSTGFFFRAEDFSAFVDSVEREKSKLLGQMSYLKGAVSESVIKQLTENMNYSLQQMRNEYGDNMLAYSHGEAYLKILETRIANKGIYLLDEPEAALSPLKQLSLIAFILEVLKNNNSQFIISTHSPILMGMPGALIYETQGDGMQRVEFRDTEHYRITKTFLDNPEAYLRHLK